ncbi:hypothetical protein AaE_010208 [Aphanomyces astaci]|uniref:Uncharacterized protein n=1 Tax=Aphanomyces astaci TaxID=112090 RepID=A0A6A5AAA0_APHAT|nr:hypothetical protein AaE_010208 [Aphanomyces astaci]
MGAGVSSSTPGLEAMPEPQQAQLRATFQVLVAAGVSEADAAAQLHAEVITSALTVQIDLTELPAAVSSAVERGKTPLVVDPSGKAATFYSYRPVTVIDGKAMALDKSMRKTGVPVVIAMDQCVVDFANTFNDAALVASGAVTHDPSMRWFPVELLFRRAGIILSAPMIWQQLGKSIVGGAVLESLYRQADKADTAGVVSCRNKAEFYVVLLTAFEPKDFEKYLFGNNMGLPRPTSMYEFIVVNQDHFPSDNDD